MSEPRTRDYRTLLHTVDSFDVNQVTGLLDPEHTLAVDENYKELKEMFGPTNTITVADFERQVDYLLGEVIESEG